MKCGSTIISGSLDFQESFRQSVLVTSGTWVSTPCFWDRTKRQPIRNPPDPTFRDSWHWADSRYPWKSCDAFCRPVNESTGLDDHQPQQLSSCPDGRQGHPSTNHSQCLRRQIDPGAIARRSERTSIPPHTGTQVFSFRIPLRFSL